MEVTLQPAASDYKLLPRRHVQLQAATSSIYDLRSVIHESVSLCCAPLLQYGLAFLQLALYTGCRDVHEETVRLPHGGARVIPRNISLTRPQLSRVLGRQEL